MSNTPAARRRTQAVPLSSPLSSRVLAGLLVACAAASPAVAGDTTPAQQLERWTAQAGKPASVETGKQFFAARHGREWSCSTCHGVPPTGPGKHASTGKRIVPLAPAANPDALTDAARADKWFRRNCRDVLDRECTAAEKADVLAYLLGLKP